MDITKIKHISQYADPYCDEVWELWSHSDFCNCEACKIFFGEDKWT